MLKRISARLLILLFLVAVTILGGCASSANLFSAMPWAGAPGGQSEPDLVYETAEYGHSEPE